MKAGRMLALPRKAAQDRPPTADRRPLTTDDRAPKGRYAVSIPASYSPWRAVAFRRARLRKAS